MNAFAGASGVAFLSGLGIVSFWQPILGAIKYSETVITEETEKHAVLDWFIGAWQDIMKTGMPPLAIPGM